MSCRPQAHGVRGQEGAPPGHSQVSTGPLTSAASGHCLGWAGSSGLARAGQCHPGLLDSREDTSCPALGCPGPGGLVAIVFLGVLPPGAPGLGPLCHLGAGPAISVLRAQPTPLRGLAGQHMTKRVPARASLLPKDGPQFPGTPPGRRKPPQTWHRCSQLLTRRREGPAGGPAQRWPGAESPRPVWGAGPRVAQCPQGAAPGRPAEPGDRPSAVRPRPWRSGQNRRRARDAVPTRHGALSPVRAREGGRRGPHGPSRSPAPTPSRHRWVGQHPTLSSSGRTARSSAPCPLTARRPFSKRATCRPHWPAGTPAPGAARSRLQGEPHQTGAAWGGRAIPFSAPTTARPPVEAPSCLSRGSGDCRRLQLWALCAAGATFRFRRENLLVSSPC